MNGVHDMGGMHGFGPIAPEPENSEELFHAEWEKRAFALTLAAGFLGQWNIDEARHARESLEPALYTRASYYEKWFEAVCKQVVDKGLVTPEELASGKAEGRVPDGQYRLLQSGKVAETFAKGGPSEMAIDNAPLYQVGDRVRALMIHPAGHTRSPRYVRGHVGEIVLHHGGHVFADDSAHGHRRGEHLYTVRFAARDLWGPDAFDGSVRVDLWEPHMERA